MREALTSISPGLRHMVAAAFFFSLMTLFVKAAGKTLPSTEIVLVRSVFGVIFTAALLKRARVSPWGHRKGLLLLRGSFGFVALCCFYYAVTHLPLAEATVIQYTNPVFVALMAGVVLKEGVRRKEIGAAVICLAGVALVTRPDAVFGAASAGFESLAITAAVIGAVVSAMSYVTVRKLGETEHHLVTVFYFPLVSAPAVLPFVIPVFEWPTAGEWLLMLGGAVFTQLAQMSMTRGLQLETAGKATSMTYLQIVFAAVWGVLFFGEIPGLMAIGGMVLIVGATAWVGRSRPRVSLRRGAQIVAEGPAPTKE